MEYVSRHLKLPEGHLILLGPRGTGKSTYLKHQLPNALWIDLLRPEILTRYIARPQYLEEFVRANAQATDIIIDEVQQVPELLNVVHRLIELRLGPRYVLTGSSARKLRRSGVNLLAGRAVLITMHPFMMAEYSPSEQLDEILQTGLLPIVQSSKDKHSTLQAYVSLYIQQEVHQESLVRKSGDFGRFLEMISFSHGSILNVSNISRMAEVPRNTVNSFIQILDDILLSFHLEVFKKRAGRKLASHPKFYFFDCGVFSKIRPAGYLDKPEEIGCAALEGFVVQHLRAWIAYRQEDARLFYWRSRGGVEVDVVVYGSQTFHALEIKNGARIRPQDLRGLKEFGIDYPEAKRIMLYRGEDKMIQDNILIIPVEHFLRNLNPKQSLDHVLQS